MIWATRQRLALIQHSLSTTTRYDLPRQLASSQLFSREVRACDERALAMAPEQKLPMAIPARMLDAEKRIFKVCTRYRL